MKRILRDLIHILVLALLWSIGGYFIGLTAEKINDYYPFSIILASSSLIVGMALFLNVTKDPTTNRLFFEGVRDDEDTGSLALGCLWLMPVGMLILGLTLWVSAMAI